MLSGIANVGEYSLARNSAWKPDAVVRKPLLYSSLDGNHYYLHIPKPLIDLNRIYFPKRTKFLISLHSNVGYHPSPSPDQAAEDVRLRDNSLGSGDFGVLHGGTFYPLEEAVDTTAQKEDYLHYGSSSEPPAIRKDLSGEREDEREDDLDEEEPFLHSTYTSSEEQFEHFRDFADLAASTEVESQLSELFVVYAPYSNKTQARTGMCNEQCNGERGMDEDGSHRQEKAHFAANILEKLQEIDRERQADKLSKIKSKLQKVVGLNKKRKPGKYRRWPKDEDPLMAVF